MKAVYFNFLDKGLYKYLKLGKEYNYKYVNKDGVSCKREDENSKVYIQFSPYYENSYYSFTIDGFDIHFRTLKQLRKMKLDKINESNK